MPVKAGRQAARACRPRLWLLVGLAGLTGNYGTYLVALAHATQLAMLVFSCANWLVAYGAFAEALEHWKASRIGAVLSLAPIFTLIGIRVAQSAAPGLAPSEQLNVWSVVGALMVVAGAAMCALGTR